MTDFEWDLPSPVTVDITARAEDIDHYGHVNIDFRRAGL